jgi:ribonuclease VapC
MVIDSSALIAMELNEPGFEELFKKIAKSGNVVIGAPTVFESAIVLTRKSGQDSRPAIMSSLRSMGVRIVAFDQDHLDSAINAFLRFGKGRHPAKLNFGDCISYAIAAVSGLPLLYTGADFSKTDILAA